MADIIELSSDSNSTIITSVDAHFYDLCAFENEAITFENLNKKVKAVGSNLDDLITTPFSTLSSDTSSDIGGERVSTQNEIHSIPNLKRKSPDDFGIRESQVNQNITNKQMMQNEENKMLEKQNKKCILNKEKGYKNTLKDIKKSMKPDECLKNIIVKIDERLQTEIGKGITEQLNNNNISYNIIKQRHKNTITWVRKIQTLENLVSENSVKSESNILLVLPKLEFKSLVSEKKINTYIHAISLQLQFSQLTIAIFGLEKLSEDEEYEITESELFFKCYWQCIKRVDQLASLIFTVTKAVAQIPYKLEKQKKIELQNEFFADTNKDTVRVDKCGNGLTRLWNQMLTMLPLARLETAEAISTAYPTPTSLFRAYENCESDKAELLQNLFIKRANVPLANSRKIGPELSRKCANYFTATENTNI